MDAIGEIAACLPAETGRALLALGGEKPIANVRLRAGQPLRAEWPGGDAFLGPPTSARELTEIVSGMLKHSLYAWEDELGAGFFTLPGGSRAGVAGRFACEGGRVRLTAIGSVCVRAARAVPGCGRKIAEAMTAGGRLKSALILAPPGAGKTTMLRDAARLLAGKGLNVAISDERGEIAACAAGVPAFDVGERTDVIYGIAKTLAIPRLLRAMAPDVLITDEIGGARDGEALREAARMGAAVLASAHAASMDDALRRPRLRGMLTDGSFALAFVLAAPGRMDSVWTYDRGWKRREEDEHGGETDRGAGGHGLCHAGGADAGGTGAARGGGHPPADG